MARKKHRGGGELPSFDYDRWNWSGSKQLYESRFRAENAILKEFPGAVWVTHPSHGRVAMVGDRLVAHLWARHHLAGGFWLRRLGLEGNGDSRGREAA